MKTKIAHITPHLGGGVGTVVLHWIAKENETCPDNSHMIICLEKNNNDMSQYTDKGFYIIDSMYGQQEKIKKIISESDIILIHWWNHPALFDIMINMDFPPCRLVIWNHVNSLYPPYSQSEKLVSFSDYFVFTSPVTYEAEEIKALPQGLKEKLDVVWSSFDSGIFKDFKRKEHDGFIVGITGTVDYGKLHPHYISMCANIRIPDVKFIVCSGDSQEHVKKDAAGAGIAERFTFNGRVPSIMPYLAIYDVFGYPLQPKHLGTCEQAIGEAMAAGVVPVVLDNPSERYIIEDGKTGIIAKNEEQYSRAVEYLYQNPQKRKEMASKAAVFAKEKYSVAKKINKWNEIFDKVLNQDKGKRKWALPKKYSGAEVFIESLGNYGNIFADYIVAKNSGDCAKLEYCRQKIKELFKSNSQWYSDNKGGVKQYLRLFGGDIFLNEWKELLSQTAFNYL